MWDYKRNRKRVPPTDVSYRLTGGDVFRTLNELWRKNVAKEHYMSILDLLCLTEDKLELDQRQFIVLCALVERFMYEQNRTIWLNRGERLKFDAFNGKSWFVYSIWLSINLCSIYALLTLVKIMKKPTFVHCTSWSRLASMEICNACFCLFNQRIVVIKFKALYSILIILNFM